MMPRILFLILIILVPCAIQGARASEVDGLACNDVCRHWLGLPASAPQDTTATVNPSSPDPEAASARSSEEPPAHPRRYRRRGPAPEVQLARATRKSARIDVTRAAALRPPTKVVRPPLPALVQGDVSSGVTREAPAVRTTSMITSGPAHDRPSWEQAALHVFQSDDDPAVAPANPGSRTLRPKRRHRVIAP